MRSKVDSSIRVVEAYGLDPISSQAIYHAVAEEFVTVGRDTILLVTPNAPYICIGYHQDAERELDLDTCHRLGLPIVRRQVGGGAVYLDNNQVFIQWIFDPDHLPFSIEDRYKFYIKPITDTYAELGIQAHYRPINDIHVDNRKIGGTGAARIGEAEIVVGSLLFDIDAKAMVQALRVSSEKMRDKLAVGISEYVTSLKRELGGKPEVQPVVDIYLSKVERSLNRHLEADVLEKSEERAQQKLREVFMTDEWTFGGAGRRILGTKIHEGVSLFEGVHKAPGGLIRWIFLVEDGIIVDATLEGDFTIIPSEAPHDLATALVGTTVDLEKIQSIIRSTFTSLRITSPGVSPDDIIQTARSALFQPASMV